MGEKLKWGILGYARIARQSVIPAIKRAANSELWAVASQRPEVRAACREETGCPRVYESYEELLADPEVRAVYIPLPNALHREWTIRAAEKGKHVLCEKPLALNAAECREMIAACRANGVKLMEAFMYRYTDRIRKVREVLASGLLGEIRYIHAEFRFFLDRDPDVRLVPELGGGCLYDVGCYPVNFIGFVTGEAPEEVEAEAVYHRGVDVSFAAVLRYKSDLIATVSSGFNSRLRTYAEIAGTKGVLEVPDTFLGDAGSIFLNTAEGRREIPVAESDRYRLEIEDFAAAVLEDRPPMLGLEESLRNMEVIERLLEAARG
ncbi:MAG: Gfo/Idh/MocA family oxidoreductase [Firmicutes bacterium]|nr:Gfo/Idh/MocA family oxidoreductase [Bacillota bacterium]